jgi:hypothetical protein
MQEVHTRRDWFLPSTTTLTFCRLGSQRRLVNLWEWLTLLPYTGFFPHISHTFAMAGASFFERKSHFTLFRGGKQLLPLGPAIHPLCNLLQTA